MTGGAILVQYDPEWPRIFDLVRANVGQAVGGLAVAIEHVGSTAVPGLSAKPIIDIDIVVRSANVVPETIARLALIGYAHQGDLGVPGREAFISPAQSPAHHLYVCPADSDALDAHLRFRDYLRANPRVADEYAALKRALVKKVGDDRAAYTAGKTAFVEAALRRP